MLPKVTLSRDCVMCHLVVIGINYYVCVFCIIFCCRSANGRELLASSLDGSISYMCFAKDEIGEPMKMEEVVSAILLSMPQTISLAR